MSALASRRETDAPPCDSLAETVVLNHLLLNPDLIGTVDVGPLLVFPEHRWCWQAMVHVHMRQPDLSFGHFYLAWHAELDRGRPGQGWRLADLLASTAADQSRRAWAEYDLDRERDADRPLYQPSYMHGFDWWLARLKAIVDARAIIAAGQELAERAWRVPDAPFSVDQAIAVLRRIQPASPSSTIRIDIEA